MMLVMPKSKDEVLFPHAPVLIAPHDLTTASSNVLLLQPNLTPWQTEVFRSGNGFEQLCSSSELFHQIGMKNLHSLTISHEKQNQRRTVEVHGSLQLRMVHSVSFGCLPFSVPKRKHFTAELGGFDCSLFSWNDLLQVIYTFSKGNVFCVWQTAIYPITCNDRLCDEDIHMDLQSLWCAILVGGILHSHHCRTKMNGSIHSSVMALRGNQRTSGSWRQNAVSIHPHTFIYTEYVRICNIINMARRRVWKLFVRHRRCTRSRPVEWLQIRVICKRCLIWQRQ